MSDVQVERVSHEGTQIDPADGVRKPVGDIVRPDAPVFETTSTISPSVSVFRDNRVTQIGADGLRHPVGDDDGVPAARHQ